MLEGIRSGCNRGKASTPGLATWFAVEVGMPGHAVGMFSARNIPGLVTCPSPNSTLEFVPHSTYVGLRWETLNTTIPSCYDPAAFATTLPSHRARGLCIREHFNACRTHCSSLLTRIRWHTVFSLSLWGTFDQKMMQCQLSGDHIFRNSQRQFCGSVASVIIWFS